MGFEESLRNKKIVISTHVYTTGPAQDLRKYLLDRKIARLVFIGHPLFYDLSLKDSGYEVYIKGRCEKKYYPDIKKRHPFYSYARSFFLNIFWIIRGGVKYDLYVGSNNLNALAGIFLRKMGFVDAVVYYVIDYNPKRFPNALVNYLYHLVDRICVRNADETWNLSSRMEESRRECFDVPRGRQTVVPVGVWLERIKNPKDLKFANNHTLAYMGHLIESKGVQYVLRAIPTIVEKLPDFKFTIIGKGEYSDTLKSIVKELKIGKYVNFMGYIEDHRELENLMGTFSVAVALYEKYINGDITFTYFADPAKIKIYLACGLPVILTDVPYSALDIQRNECGLVIDLDENSIADAVIKLMGDSKTLKKYRSNAIKYSKKFDWNKIFSSNLGRILKINMGSIEPSSSGGGFFYLLSLYGIRKAFLYVLYEGRRRFYYQKFRKSFSQGGEDLIIDKLLGFKKDGFYVDIGAYDPHRFSNTKRFYQKGWRGINIEPNFENYEKFEMYRPLDINLNIGVSLKEGKLDFYRMFPTTLSTFSKKDAESCRDLGYKVLGSVPVAVAPLSSILDKYADGKIDFFSVDTEGFDLEVLKSNNWKKYRPSVICIESASPGHLGSGGCDGFLLKKGYKKVLDNGINSIFSL